MLIFDPSKQGPRFTLVLDQVMGGRSSGELRAEVIDGRPALRLVGHVRLDNGGGFVQMAANLELDLSSSAQLRLLVLGNGETYGCHLKTPDVRHPWQSYRQSFRAPPVWTVVDLPVDGFVPHRIDAPLDRSRVRRLGLVAIGKAMTADLALASISVHSLLAK